MFVPLQDGKPSGDWQMFADYFASDPIKDNVPANAERTRFGDNAGAVTPDIVAQARQTIDK